MIIKMVDQIREWKKDKNTKNFEWDKLIVLAQQFDAQNDLEIKKYEMQLQNSPIAIAERIANIRYEIESCGECDKVKENGIKKAIENYKKIGSVKDQIERGERIITRNPDQELIDIKNGNVIFTCSIHRKNTILLRELYKVHK